MKLVARILGVVAVLVGLHWIGQGTGYFTWPDNPVMDNNPTWIYVGAGTLLAGLFLFAWSRR